MRFVRRLVRLLFSLLRGIVWVTGMVTLVALVLLAVAERPLPRETVSRLLDRLSTDDECLDARSGAFGLRGGLVLRNVRLLTKHVAAPPWITADELRISGSLHPSRTPSQWADTILAHKLNVVSLPDSLPTLFSAPASSNAAAATPQLSAPVRFDIVDASFVGLHFKRLRGWLRQEAGAVVVDDAHIEWMAAGPWTEDVVGHVRFDPSSGYVEGLLSGHAMPEKIYPLFQLLHAHDVEDICRRFTFPNGPVEVEARFLVAPEKHRTNLRLTLAIHDCTYTGVAVRRASAILEADGSNGLDRVTIRPLVGERTDGTLSGGLVYDCDRNNLEVLAQSDLPLDPLLRIIGLTNALDRVRNTLVFDTPPHMTASGFVAFTSSRDSTTLTGTLSSDACTVQGVAARGVQAEFAIATNVYQIRQVRATVADGALQGDIAFQYQPGATTVDYRTSFQIRDLDLARLTAAFGLTNPPPGRINATVELQSKMDAAQHPSLSGQGDLKLTNGVISRIPLFAGFTDYMARNVPGVESIVNQSEARLPFTITNNVLRSDGALIEGNIFSLAGKGVYRIPEDRLDFSVQAGIFKRRTWLGKISHLVTFPFAKLLLEFHVHGPAGHPAWDYRGILERIGDSMGDGAGAKKDVAPQ